MDQMSKKGDMKATVEITEARPTSHGRGSKLASPMDQGTSHLPISQPSSGSGGSTFKPKAGGKSPSRKSFLKRKFPLCLKRKGPANSPQGLAVSRSRLCVEATQESPIQAVRKPVPQREAFGLDSGEGSTREKTGSSLLRKLWCLKATNSRLKKPPRGRTMSPLQRAPCGPVAALSRTADPHGESPLRWKPRAETQNSEEVGSPAKPEKEETVDQLGASWLTKPWRTFRTMMTARAKKASVFSGNQKNPGVPTEPETSPATRKQQNNVVAVEDKTPPSTPPSVVDELYGAQEDEGGNRTPQRRLESHRRMEAISKPVPKLPVRKENGYCEGSPIFELVSELGGIQTKVCPLPGEMRLEAGGAGAEGKAPNQADDEFWPEVSTWEDLAELAENPGGQGMVMATRGLEWLSSEGLVGPKVEGKPAISTRSNPNTQGIEEERERHSGTKCSYEQASGVAPGKASTASCLFPPALSENGTSGVVTAPPSGTSTLEEVGAPYSAFSQETSLPELCPSLPSREVERGAEVSLTPTPIQTAAQDPPREDSLLSTTRPHGATGWPGTGGPEESQKRLIYVAAVEIVEAAIDAAAEQLAKKREQEKAGHWGHAEVATNSSAGVAMRQRGWLT